jgi:uncharacterized Zn finger protein (UPF0148 family)
MRSRENTPDSRPDAANNADEQKQRNSQDCAIDEDVKENDNSTETKSTAATTVTIEHLKRINVDDVVLCIMKAKQPIRRDGKIWNKLANEPIIVTQ